MSIKIFIADDHPLIIYGIEQLLGGEKSGIILGGSFENGAALLEGLKIAHPDVLLLDIHMPGTDGFELAGYISKHYPDVRILAITNQEDIESVRYMMSRGAAGYLLKTAGYEVIVHAIKTVFEGGQYIDGELHDRLVQYSLDDEVQKNGPVKLTRREREILKLISSNYTSQEIADKLFLSKRTVDNHRFNLLTKLDVKNAPALIKKAMELRLLE